MIRMGLSLFVTGLSFFNAIAFAETGVTPMSAPYFSYTTTNQTVPVLTPTTAPLVNLSIDQPAETSEQQVLCNFNEAKPDAKLSLPANFCGKGKEQPKKWLPLYCRYTSNALIYLDGASVGEGDADKFKVTKCSETNGEQNLWKIECDVDSFTDLEINVECRYHADFTKTFKSKNDKLVCDENEVAYEVSQPCEPLSKNLQITKTQEKKKSIVGYQVKTAKYNNLCDEKNVDKQRDLCIQTYLGRDKGCPVLTSTEQKPAFVPNGNGVVSAQGCCSKN